MTAANGTAAIQAANGTAIPWSAPPAYISVAIATDSSKDGRYTPWVGTAIIVIQITMGVVFGMLMIYCATKGVMRRCSGRRTKRHDTDSQCDRAASASTLPRSYILGNLYNTDHSSRRDRATSTDTHPGSYILGDLSRTETIRTGFVNRAPVVEGAVSQPEGRVTSHVGVIEHCDDTGPGSPRASRQCNTPESMV